MAEFEQISSSMDKLSRYHHPWISRAYIIKEQPVADGFVLIQILENPLAQKPGLAVRSKADEILVIVETLICPLQISHLTRN